MTAITKFDQFEALLGSSPSETSPDAVSSNTSAPSGLRVLDGAGNDLAIAGDAYEGSSMREKEIALWQPNLRSADQDVMQGKRMSDARVRDTLRNDAYVRGGATLHKDNIVGGRFVLNAQPLSRILFGKVDDAFEEDFQEEVEPKFTLWAESNASWIDTSRRNSLTMMIRQAVGTYLATGEVLAVVDWAKPGKTDSPFQTSLRMVDIDRLNTPYDRMGDPYTIGGVTVERGTHRPLSYWIRKAHPTEARLPESQQWENIDAMKPWGRPQVIHLFEQERSGQTRGISDVTAALKEMRQTKDFRDVVLQNAVVQATYAATIESDLDTQTVFQRLGGGNVSEDLGESFSAYMAAHLGAIGEYVGASNQFKLNGVKIPHLPPGSKLTLQNAGNTGPLGEGFEQSLLRHIAASLGVSYEQLSRDYTNTNYSSARAAMSETWKFMQSRKTLIADRYASIAYRLWLEENLNRGLIESVKRKMRNDTAWLYEPLMMEAVTNCSWIGASQGQIDELKETQAAVLRLNNNLSTDEAELARLGKDWRQVKRQRAREKAMDTELGIEAQDTNMMNAASGTPSEAQDPGNSKTTKKTTKKSSARAIRAPLAGDDNEE